MSRSRRNLHINTRPTGEGYCLSLLSFLISKHRRCYLNHLEYECVKNITHIYDVIEYAQNRSRHDGNIEIFSSEHTWVGSGASGNDGLNVRQDDHDNPENNDEGELALWHAFRRRCCRGKYVD